MKKLFIISNESIFDYGESFFCDNIDLKSTPEGLSNEFEVNLIGRKSTKIIDVSGDSPIEYIGEVPERSVVIPGSYTKKFKAGDYQVPCALIIGKRKASTDLKTSLNDVLRDYSVAV